MTSSPRHPHGVTLRAARGAVLVLALGGCTAPWGGGSYPSPPSEEIRAGLGTVSLAEDDETPPRQLVRRPMGTAESTASGAAEGMAAGLDSVGDVSGPAALVIPIVLVAAVIGAAGGAAFGSTQGTDRDESALAADRIQRAFEEADLIHRMNQEVLRRLGETTREVTVTGASGSVDTYLEVRVLQAGLVGGREGSAPRIAFLVVQARLVRARDRAELYSNAWTVPGLGNATFSAWAADDARRVRLVLPRLVAAAAESVIEEVFLVHDPERSGRASR